MDNHESYVGTDVKDRRMYMIRWTDPDESPLEAIGRLNQEVIEVAADARRPYAVSQMANIMKLQQLAEDANAKYQDSMASDTQHRAYYAGMEDGFRRAIKVLEGRG